MRAIMPRSAGVGRRRRRHGTQSPLAGRLLGVVLAAADQLDARRFGVHGAALIGRGVGAIVALPDDARAGRRLGARVIVFRVRGPLLRRENGFEVAVAVGVVDAGGKRRGRGAEDLSLAVGEVFEGGEQRVLGERGLGADGDPSGGFGEARGGVREATLGGAGVVLNGSAARKEGVSAIGALIELSFAFGALGLFLGEKAGDDRNDDG